MDKKNGSKQSPVDDAKELKKYVARQLVEKEASQLVFDGSTVPDRFCALDVPLYAFNKYQGKDLRAFFDDLVNPGDGVSPSLASTVRLDREAEEKRKEGSDSALSSSSGSLPVLKEIMYWVINEDGRLPILAQCNKDRKRPVIVNLTRDQVNGQLYFKAATFREFQVSAAGGKDAIKKESWEFVLELHRLSREKFTFVVEREDSIFISDVDLDKQRQERLLESKRGEAEVAVLLMQELQQLQEIHAAAMTRFMEQHKKLEQKLEGIKGLRAIKDLTELEKIHKQIQTLKATATTSPSGGGGP